MTESQTTIRWTDVFAALASEPRLRIVRMLAKGEVQCQEILTQIELSQPAVSYHLAKLERAGILVKERQGTRNCYRLEERVRKLIRMITKEDK